MNNQKPIYDLHAEHKAWLSQLSFYKDELAIMQGRIEEITNKNTSKEILSMVDHFQNQFFIQGKQISDLTHEIKTHEAKIEASIINNPVATDHRKIEDHSEHREQMKRFEELFTQMKKELMSFLAKNM